MGNCICRESAISQDSTAKLILLNGQLQEFRQPIKAALLMERNPSCFICSASKMEFGQLVAGVGGEEVLRPGEVYFELPISWQSHTMKAEDMAALAVKASVALSGGGYDERKMTSCGCCLSRRKVEPVVVFLGEESLPTPPPSPAGGGKGGAGGWKQRHKFTAELSAIIEE